MGIVFLGTTLHKIDPIRPTVGSIVIYIRIALVLKSLKRDCGRFRVKQEFLELRLNTSRQRLELTQ